MEDGLGTVSFLPREQIRAAWKDSLETFPSYRENRSGLFGKTFSSSHFPLYQENSYQAAQEDAIESSGSADAGYWSP